MPRPRTLTHPELAEAAIAVIDRDGLAGLTMRTLATRLGRSPMALYRYIRDRDELELLVVEHLLGQVDTTPPPEGPWAERVEVMVHRLRAAIRAHPAAIPLTPTHRHRSLALLRWTETVLGILTEAGIAGRDRAIAMRCLIAYLIGAIQIDHHSALSGDGTLAIAGLPAAEFPNLAETGRTALDIDPDQEFDGGLAVLLRGLTTG